VLAVIFRARRFLLAAFAAATLAPALVCAIPGHYVVVRIDAAGQVVPVFHRSVQLDEAPMASSQKALTLARANPDQLTVRAGEWATVVDVPRFVRGEFAANGVDGAIESFLAPEDDRSFVLRIPASVGEEIVVASMGRETDLNLAVLEATAEQLPLADAVDAAGDFPTKSLGPSANRVDVLVMGDGYTSAERTKFATDVENMRVAMFGFTPYREYAPFVNWTSLYTESAESGADHPPYQAGCTTTSCCAETAAQTDPRANTFVNTAFDGRFCTSQIHRLVTVSNSKVLAAAGASPNWDEIIVLVNDPVYGGAGGSISVTTTNTSARLIVVHEYGHTFHRLADEYTTAYPGFGACNDITASPRCEANVTNQTDAAQIKWASWITPGNAIPTPGGTSGIGLFEGARYQTTGMYRPANACAMRNLGAQFCAVCSQEYVLRLYRGGWGSPSAGIDLIEPGSESPNPAATVNIAAGAPQVFTASILRPDPNSITLQWYVDGVAVPGANAASFTFTPATTTPATRQVELRATDTSALVRTAMAGTDLVHSRVWNVQVLASGTPTLTVGNLSANEGNAGATVFDVPVSLSVPAGGSGVTVSLSTVDETATAPSDYTARTATVSIAAGQSSGVFAVNVNGDTVGESDETFRVRATAVTGASLADNEGVVTVLNDDGAVLPAFAARGDRFTGAASSAALVLPVLGNDVADAARLGGGTLTIVRAPVRGSAVALNAGTANTVADDTISYTPASSTPSEESLRYRLCETGGRCSEAEVIVLRRSATEQSVSASVTSDRGWRDVSLSGLPALPDARFEAHGLVAPTVISPSLTADLTPETPWDAGGTNTTVRTLAAIASARDWRVFVDARSLSGGDVDVYVGLDSNNNSAADQSELVCTGAMSVVSERCELAFSQAANTAVRYWVMLHSRSGGTQNTRAELFEVPLDVAAAQRSLVATGPGALASSAGFPLRLAWNDPSFLPNESRGGWLLMKSNASTELGWVPVRLDRTAGEAVAFALHSGVDHRMALAASGSHERLYVDVPPGSTQLQVTTTSASNVNLFLARIDAPAASSAVPSVAAAPARNQAIASATTGSGNESLTVSNPAAGRWYVTPVNATNATASLTVRATITATAPVVRAGGYFNPQRSGNGLFLYPAASDWAGLWYTYLQDGTTTWYYLQGAAPGANGVWRGTIYRSAWNGSSNRLTTVGEATATPTGADAFTYTYTLDGETGSEAYAAFGRGCPNLGGNALNVSGHWFNPARSGTGYSVQLFPNYEFYLVFGYDGQGVPRFLVAERSSMGGASETLNLEQLTGACPLCARSGNPTRSTIGTFQRTFAGGSFGNISLNGTFTAGVPGTWAANDALTPLGGLQGCATP
jgi:hypothetical protein